MFYHISTNFFIGMVEVIAFSYQVFFTFYSSVILKPPNISIKFVIGLKNVTFLYDQT